MAEWLPEQVEEFRERFREAMRNPRWNLAQPARTPPRPREFAGNLAIEWPSPSRGGVLAGWKVTLTNHETGEQVTTVTHITVHLHAGAQEAVWADVTMWADADHNPVFTGDPVVVDGEVVLGTFPFWVAEMRVAA